jgi:hypothetical protein
MGAFAYRLIGAAMLDAGMYESIEADRRSTRQALFTVLLSSAAAGIGSSGWHGPRPAVMAAFAALALLAWAAWALLILQIGRWLRTPSTHVTIDELLRTIGFAAAPGLLQAFGAFPRMRGPVFAATGIWMFVAMVVAVKHALDFQSTLRALATCAIAAGIVLALVLGFGVFFGPTMS